MSCSSCRKVSKIVKGYAMLAFGINGKLSKKRMRICRNCVNYRDGYCAICGCDMAAKTRVKEETCPLKKPKWEPTI